MKQVTCLFLLSKASIGPETACEAKSKSAVTLTQIRVTGISLLDF